MAPDGAGDLRPHRSRIRQVRTAFAPAAQTAHPETPVDLRTSSRHCALADARSCFTSSWHDAVEGSPIGSIPRGDVKSPGALA